MMAGIMLPARCCCCPCDVCVAAEPDFLVTTSGTCEFQEVCREGEGTYYFDHYDLQWYDYLGVPRRRCVWWAVKDEDYRLILSHFPDIEPKVTRIIIYSLRDDEGPDSIGSIYLAQNGDMPIGEINIVCDQGEFIGSASCTGGTQVEQCEGCEAEVTVI